MNTVEQPPDLPVKILIAEDSPTQARHLQHILEKHGYQVIVAINGRLALETAKHFAPSVIISDVVMPEMDGYELSRRVKADPELRNIPVILVTTMSDPQDVIRGLESGADNFVLKPYNERYLLSRVQFVLLNREMYKAEESGTGIEILFAGRKHYITANRLQILNLLLSTYDAAIQRNNEINRSREGLQLLNAQLTDANKDLESFSYSVSHDLRSPLAVINGYSQILQEDYVNKLDAEGLGLFGAIREGTRRMELLIDGLLAFSKLGRQAIGKTAVDMNLLVQEVIRELGTDGNGESSRIMTTDLPHAWGDRILLKQVWVNLLSNAIKFSGKNGEALIEVSGNRAGEENIYNVKDNGAGFDMRYYEKLFGVFQRLHSTTEYPGTGVGLAIVQRVVTRHGGRVWAEGKPNAGAIFCFALPQAKTDGHDADSGVVKGP